MKKVNKFKNKNLKSLKKYGTKKAVTALVAFVVAVFGGTAVVNNENSGTKSPGDINFDNIPSSWKYDTEDVRSTCNLNGKRKANNVSKIGVGDNRQYYSLTNSTGQLVKVYAKQIFLQLPKEEGDNGRFCERGAKIDGIGEDTGMNRGHIIADALGGVSNSYNLVPQDIKVNKYGQQDKMEKYIINKINAGHKITDFEANIIYANKNDDTPIRFEYKFLDNGKLKTYNFANKM